MFREILDSILSVNTITMSASTKIAILTITVLLVLQSACRIPFFDADRQMRERMSAEIFNVECDNNNRLDAVQKLFSRHGLDYSIEKFETATNIAVDSAGGRETLVIGAHYDKTEMGCGAIDNWTGVVILAMLAKKFTGSKNRKSFRFVAFGSEEEGLRGSRAMIRELRPAAKEAVCAMVNLDSFGIDETWALESISTRPMLMLAAEVERRRGGSLSIRNYRGASSDSLTFREAGIPAITLSGLDDDWRDYLHKEGDQAGKIDIDKVFRSYLFAEAIIERLDGADCNALTPG